MSKEFIDQWIKKIASSFPADAEMSIIEDSRFHGVKIRVHWPLHNDPKRPNKISRPIIIHITKEAIDDCSDPGRAGKRFEGIIKNKLAEFEPGHDCPRHVPVPEETWKIETFDIN